MTMHDNLPEETLRMQADEERVAAFRGASAQGDAQLDRGEGIPYTPALMDSIMQEVLEGKSRTR